MFKRLLVPLDGSKLAEVALPIAALLCKKLDAKVTLLHIIEQDAPKEIHGDRHLTNEEDACRYLGEIAENSFPEDVAECHVHTEKVEDVARSIAEHSGELEPDLIVMCTHGAGGLHDFMVGSIAQQVIGRGKTPILLVSAAPDSTQEVDFKNIVVALDGLESHEGALPAAAELAQKTGAGLHLLNVVPTLGTLRGERAASGWMLPGVTRAMLDIDEDSAREYLEKLAGDWRKTGLKISIEIRRGDPAQQIVSGAEENHADLIILATHGKAGMSAFWSSSVGPKVVDSSHLPLLLIPVRK